MLASGSGPISSPYGLAVPGENAPFFPLEPLTVTGENSNSFHTNQQPGLEAPFQNIQDQFGSLNFGSNEYLYGSNGFPDFPYPIFGHIDQLGGPSCARSSTQACVIVKMASPKPRDERPIEHRRDIQLKLEISVPEDHFGVDPLEYCIKVPKTKSVKTVGSRFGRTVLDLRLEVQGATTDKALISACRACSIRESSPSAHLPMVDFVAKEDLINVKRGKANIAIRFLCLPGHHGTMDKEYKLSAVILDGDQILRRTTFPNWLRVVSHLHRKRNILPSIIPQGIETSTVMEFPCNSAERQRDLSNPPTHSSRSSGTYAGEDQRSERVQSLSSAVQSPTAEVAAPIPQAHGESESAGQHGLLQTSAAPVNEHVAEEGPVLSRVNPRRGPTSGGDEIDLIVSNLPTTIKLYARFGCNITPTAHIAPGVLLCVLPPAAHPGMVNVTLCQAPSTNADPYGRSLASFEYEADSTKAVSLLLKLLHGKLLLDFMPLIRRLLQRDAGSPGSEAEPDPLDSNMSPRSSLPESAFLDILSALEHLSDFPLLLATVNKQGQTLLHLAVHLRYRELVQKLVHRGIDLNIRDINGCTALHAAYLCNDPFVVGFLEAEGATPFVLDELGRSPTELAVTISSANGITTTKVEEIVPSAVGQSKEQRIHYRNPGTLRSRSRVLTAQMPTKTQIINHYRQGNRAEGGARHQSHFELLNCDGHTDAFPKWGCRVFIDGILRGHSVDCSRIRLAKEEACKQAANALGLNRDEGG